MNRKKNIVIFLSVIVISFLSYVAFIYIQTPYNSISENKIAQISFDDVYLCLKDLKDNEGDYISIFQQPFFKELKYLHDTYDAVFSLYVFESAEGFDIATIPIKYKLEFHKNASWLKFGYHAMSPKFDKKRCSECFMQSIDKVNNSIKSWAGKESLTSCLRLHYYYADSIMIHNLRERNIYRLLGADDEGRISYDLSAVQSDSLYKLRHYTRDSILYFKTDVRVERMRPFPLELLDIQNQDTIILFTHEWAIMKGIRKSFNKMKLRKSIEWLNENNYKFSFLE